MTQNMTQLEITNKENTVKLEEMEREKVRRRGVYKIGRMIIVCVCETETQRMIGNNRTIRCKIWIFSCEK